MSKIESAIPDGLPGRGMTASELDSLPCACCKDASTSHPGKFFFYGQCHPEAPVWVCYHKGFALLDIRCAECHEVVTVIEVAP